VRAGLVFFDFRRLLFERAPERRRVRGSVAKPIVKITVRCPHCRAEQQEPELVKSTFCRKCSEHFAISAATLASAPLPPSFTPAVRTRHAPVEDADEPDAPAHFVAAAAAETPAGTGLLRKIDGFFGSKPKHRVVQCFECNSTHEVSTATHSSTCKACGAYIDLTDHKIASSFSRNIKTRGDVYLSPKGDLSSSKVICRDAVLHGKMRANMVCTGRLTVKMSGRLSGSVEAAELVIERGAEVTFSRPVKVSSAEIHGEVVGHFQADHVTIYKHGSLDGAVFASGFTVEKGGVFQGELTISPRKREEASTSAAEIKAEPGQGEAKGAPLMGGATIPVAS
jgi:cytoskeletal protein CcmA (bactofilin family)